MKKILIVLLTAAMSISVLGVGVFAHGHHRRTVSTNYAGNHCGFIDENCDGICDNCSTGSGMVGCTGHCTSYIENGMCDCNTVVYAYIDTNKNGFCDNCGGVNRSSGARYYNSICKCTKTVCNFIDEDGDGLCDECAAARQTYIANQKSCHSHCH